MASDNQYKGVENASSNISVEEIEPSTLENIDFAFFDFINDKMNNRATTNEGWKKVPVIWASAERSFLSKNNKDLRDSDGSLILPLITIERTSMNKSKTRKGKYYGLSGNFPEADRFGRITIARKIVRDKTNNFSVADNRKRLGGAVNRVRGRQAYFPKKQNDKVVYETLSIPMPVYVSMNYDVTLRSEYVQQMNDIMSPFITLGSSISSFTIEKNSHRYETFLQEGFNLANNVSSLGTDERMYTTKISFEVLGYLIGEAPNGERAKIIRRENAVEVKIPRERVIFGDIPDYGDGKSKYTE
jgi:hypothetical protein|tara:strand:+ start:807 stop:1709 length:903 start_codon:yes stop_codon:yes gene_type:complete